MYLHQTNAIVAYRQQLRSRDKKNKKCQHKDDRLNTDTFYLLCQVVKIR